MLTQQSELPRSGGPEIPVRPAPNPKARIGRRRLTDRLARGIVTLGGMLIILSILAILFVIAFETLPLFRDPTATARAPLPAKYESPHLVGSDDYQEIGYVVTPAGLHFLSLKDGAPIPSAPPAALKDAVIAGTSMPVQGAFLLGLKDGRIAPARISFAIDFVSDLRRVTPVLKVEEPVTVDPSGRALRFVAQGARDGAPVLAAAIGPREVALATFTKKKGLLDDGKMTMSLRNLTLALDGEITAMALDGRADDLFVGTSTGRLVRVDLREPGDPKTALPLAAARPEGTPITLLGLLLGDRTLVVGDAQGGVSTWQMLRSSEGEPYLERVHAFEPHSSPVVGFSPSQRNKGFVTADSAGTLHLNYGTTGRTLLTLRPGAPGPLRAVAMAPRANGILAIDATGNLSRWDVKNPHPEVTLNSLFGKVWYEGYSEPAWVWQSTGGTDDFESKLSLTPLIVGTLKGTFYALLVAIPLALLSALYVSQFMHPAIKSNVKPVLEIMAALPSVVLGFIAGLWLAPKVERYVPGIFLLPLVAVPLILLALVAWKLVPARIRTRFRHGSEVLLLVPVVLAATWISFQLGGAVEATLLGGDYRGWLFRALGLTFDQRNSLVVGLAMGFAVIPIIFTIAEDSLSNVPAHLSAGSLALGATRWQTAVQVVLPSASPGIFSAVMIGLGRAVGETMIVLMATGNTPVMNASIFSGFRALSANVAVELPEAPEGETLFRVLFLAAFLLFVMTFIVNTLAEIIRLRLRRRYQTL